MFLKPSYIRINMKLFYISTLFFISSIAFSQIYCAASFGSGLSSAKDNYGEATYVRFEIDFRKFFAIDVAYTFLDLHQGKETSFEIHKMSLLIGKNHYFLDKNFCLSAGIGPSFSTFESKAPQDFKFKTATGVDLRFGMSFRAFYGLRFEFSEELNLNTNERHQTIFCFGFKYIF